MMTARRLAYAPCCALDMASCRHYDIDAAAATRICLRYYRHAATLAAAEIRYGCERSAPRPPLILPPPLIDAVIITNTVNALHSR